MSEFLSQFVSMGNTIIWGYILIYLLVGVGVYYTFKTKFIQFRRFGHMIELIKTSRNNPDKNNISSFQAFCTGLAARVGTGNLAGVAIAISLGGPGAVFWMWAIALIGMSTGFIESLLAQVYKIKNPDGSFRGGPAYYMEQGLGQRWMGTAFAIFLIIAFGFAFNSVQSNTIAAAVETAWGIDKSVMGMVLVVLAGLNIFGGIRAIGRTAEILVPFMAVAYLGLSLFIVVTHITEMPAVFSLIIKSAFGLQEAAGGVAGYAVAQAMMQGIKRGLFSNEAGMGSAPNAAAAARPTPNHPASQGYIQAFGVFVDTIIICSATAAIVLLSGVLESGSEATGIALTQIALSELVGSWGSDFIAVIVLLFSFTSIIANYAYGESNVAYIFKSKHAITIYRVAVLGMVMMGALAELPAVWNFADLSMGLMAIINLIAILLLSKVAMAVLRDYEKQVSAGKTPEFNPETLPELKGKKISEVWTKKQA
ncbi:alanine/glycine:cation symporter family protein [Pelagibaculum spongiae]|uniref:Sodium:alanine symporter family protein n=1 Tax=Pelagibaculum spongiae TaxID=2080658 RepID=A0A2V1GXZ7_9GAMM|nr:sodium:alanine symporter family protein [Pelagibaculum spongiae]PVZ66412.1 sodium:alanine symporter family protein [Pelagibaculum spongiae]